MHIETNRKKTIIVAAVLCLSIIISTIIIGYSVSYYKYQTTFHPPVADATAVNGIPNPPDDMSFGTFFSRNGQILGACGNLTLNGNQVDLYATFFGSTEDCNVKVQIIDTNTEEVLGESGLLSAGQYVQTITLDTVPTQTTDVSIKFKAYEPETYYSAGSFEMDTVLNVPNTSNQ